MDKIDWIIPPGDILLLIGESHFGVQPSVRREAFGLESLRYMACGRPQVCVPTQCSGWPKTRSCVSRWVTPRVRDMRKTRIGISS